ncbi:hypothetical protein EYF80_055498 [Liparis tanakae]|uniref:Uncharacterized protein n=1 Tax=Liparis tanakae TaxID=230148 RepID=A0A4Z2F0D5_9TELE|nr:hypothetical protein EYF80_055498 [Liparis tanakae]
MLRGNLSSSYPEGGAEPTTVPTTVGTARWSRAATGDLLLLLGPHTRSPRAWLWSDVNSTNGELHVEPEDRGEENEDYPPEDTLPTSGAEATSHHVQSPGRREPRPPGAPSPNPRTRNGVASQRGLEPAERMLAPKSPHSVRLDPRPPTEDPGRGLQKTRVGVCRDRASGLQRGLCPVAALTPRTSAALRPVFPHPVRLVRCIYLDRFLQHRHSASGLCLSARVGRFPLSSRLFLHFALQEELRPKI